MYMINHLLKFLEDASLILSTPVGTWEQLAWVQAVSVLVFFVASWANVVLMLDYKSVRVLPLTFALLWFGRGLFSLALTVQTSYWKLPPLRLSDIINLLLIIIITLI